MKKLVLAAVLSISLLSCKQEETAYKYKYADQPLALTCEDINAKLYSEAYYAFENAITIHAKNNNKRPNFKITPEYALRSYIRGGNGNIQITDYVTKEVLEIFNTLKKQDIWNGIQLKSNSAVTECIGNNIANSQIKGAFNTLRSVESLDPKLLVSVMIDDRSIRGQFKDKALMTYAALDLYYAKFYYTDFSNTEFLVEKEPVIIPTQKTSKPEIGKKLNVTKKEVEKHGPNDGHNH